MFSAGISKQVAASGGPVDPQFNYVTALLHGDGTNGAQNNTFVDTSGNGLAITRNGTPTQGTFSPYGSLWSNYFNGGTDFLTIPSNSAFNLTGSFTVETWVYLSANPNVNSDTVTTATVCAYGISSSSNTGFEFNLTTGASGFIIFNKISTQTGIKCSYVFTLNNWYHIAATYNGTTGAIYVNGVSQTLINNNWSWSAPPTPGFFIARNLGVTGYLDFFPGYISNLRIVNGSVVYTSNFTPPISPLTAITNTALLTCQSNRFIDNSSNNLTITTNSNPVIVKNNPFLPTSTQAYSTSVIGGSAYFNGSTDYLTAPSSSFYAIGTTGTIEAWVYLTAYNANQRICCITSTGNTLDAYITSSGLIGAYGGIFTTTTGAISLNTWAHVAIVLTSGVPKVYVNGVSQTLTGTTSGINISSTGTLYIANYSTGTSYVFNGYMEDFRVTNTAVYSANFTPPTAPLTAISGTVILLNYVNAGIYDNAMQNDILTVSTTYPSITTANKQYGTGSIYSQATGNYLYFPKSNTFYMGSGDFTIEFWIYCNSNSGAIIDQFPNASGSYLTGQYNIILLTTNKLNFTVAASASSTASFTTTGSFATNTWTHVALVRSSGVLKFYINGTADATTLTSSLSVGVLQTAGYMMNNANGQNNPMVGYLDDVRMTPGFARYTSNFTRPSAAFPNYGR